MNHVLKNIKVIRIQKGYSQEYMANELDLSQVAYTNLENNKSKLTVERLYKISEVLDTPIEEIMEIKATQIYNQKLNDSSVGHQIGHQEVENLYHEIKEQNQKIIELYEARLKDKDKIIAQLQKP